MKIDVTQTSILRKHQFLTDEKSDLNFVFIERKTVFNHVTAPWTNLVILSA